MQRFPNFPEIESRCAVVHGGFFVARVIKWDLFYCRTLDFANKFRYNKRQAFVHLDLRKAVPSGLGFPKQIGRLTCIQNF